MIKTAYVLIISILVSFLLQAQQDELILINSGALIDSAIHFHDQGKFQEAIHLYQKINPSDTNYIYSQSELMTSYLAKGENQKTIDVGVNLLDKRTSYHANIYNNLGSAYDHIGQSDKALEIYTEGIEHFPYFTSLIFNKGVTLMAQEKYKAAGEQFQQVLFLNPFHSRSHIYLARIMIKQGHWTKAMMGLQMYCAINRNDNEALVLLNDLVQTSLKEDNSIVPFEENPYIYEDRMLKSLGALDSRYTTKVSLDAPVVKQSELLFDIIRENSESNNFWVSFYQPLYKGLLESKHNTAWIYYFLYSTNNEKIRSWTNDHLAEIDTMVSSVQSIMYANRERRLYELDGVKANYSFDFYDSGQLFSIGAKDESGVEDGSFEYYYSNGALRSKGSYITGKKINEWRYYLPTGSIDAIENYNSGGELEGPYINYYKNGTIKSEFSYLNGLLQGNAKFYYDCGALQEEYSYIEGKLEGDLKGYFVTGEISYVSKFENGLLNGPYKSYYMNQELEYIITYIDGEKEGPTINYFPNGAVALESIYSKGSLNGSYKSYYENGALKYKYAMVNDKIVGKYQEYIDDNTMILESTYNDSSELEGEYIRYDIDGKKYATLVYQNGALKSYSFFDKKGDNISSKSELDSIETIYFLDAGGNVNYQSQYVNGKKQGPEIEYYKNGSIKTRSDIYKGQIHGDYIEYHENDTIMSQSHLVNGNYEGLYQSYYKNGQLKEEGYYSNNLRLQEWREYHMDGHIKTLAYYRVSGPHGDLKEYNFDGKLYLKNVFNEGEQASVTYYDSLGSPYQTISFTPSLDSIEILYNDGSLRFSSNYDCNQSSGELISYYRSGKIKTSLARENQKTEGPYVEYNLDGGKDREFNYSQDMVHGSAMDYNRSGDLIYEYQYYYDELKGPSIQYYDNGTIESQCNYVNGNKVGTCNYYDETGQLQVLKTFDSSGRLLNYQYLLPNGDTSTARSINLEGPDTLRAFYPNGSPALLQLYQDGLSHGTVVSYYSNGQVETEIEYSLGDYHGSYLVYYANGNMKESRTYYYDELQGDLKLYHPTGKLKESISYKEGQKNGTAILYDVDGKEYYRTMFSMDDEY